MCSRGQNIIRYAELSQMTMRTTILTTYAIRQFIKNKTSNAIMKVYSYKRPLFHHM
jgi:hypothetical protein